MDTIDRRNPDRDCGPGPTHDKGGYPERLHRERQGWFSIIEEVSAERVRTYKDASILSDMIFTKRVIHADVRVHLVEDDAGAMAPILYELQRVYDD